MIRASDRFDDYGRPIRTSGISQGRQYPIYRHLAGKPRQGAFVIDNLFQISNRARQIGDMHAEHSARERTNGLID